MARTLPAGETPAELAERVAPEDHSREVVGDQARERVAIIAVPIAPGEVLPLRRGARMVGWFDDHRQWDFWHVVENELG